MAEQTALVVVITIIAVSLMIFFERRVRAGARFGLRPLGIPEQLRLQIGRAVESGGLLHITLGRAALHSQAGPTSVAALLLLDELARDSSRNGIPPVVTMADGTLFVAGQDTLRHAYEVTGRGDQGRFDNTLFLAPQDFPMTYAAGVTAVLSQEDIANQVAVGRFGGEIGIIGEAAARAGIGQVLGTDDPTAMAVSTAVTDNVMWGEELFAAPAYLDPRPARLASLRTQDVARWIAAAFILVAALLQFVGLL